MKKILVIALALVMAFCMFGCGQEQGSAENADSQIGETFTAIPLGGGLGDLQLGENGLGNEYVKIEVPEAINAESEGCTTDVYYCADCDTPYISVYRWAKEDKSLEEMTAIEAEDYGTGGYQMAKWELNEKTYDVGFYNGIAMGIEGLEDECYYLDNSVYEDGDDFVEINFYIATEEYELGEGINQYLWIPKGYDAENAAKMEEEYDSFNAKYSEDYYLPEIWISPYEESYEYETELWSFSFPDGLPYTKEQYTKWQDEGWSEAALQEYYDAIGLNIKYQASETINGCETYRCSGEYRGRNVTDAYIYIDEKTGFNIWLDTELDPAPWYARVILLTLHSK